MIRTSLFRRLTHKYRDGWSHEDQHEYLCGAKLTPAKLVREPEGFDDGGTYIMHATVPRGFSPRQARAIEQALEDSLGGSSCRHEHDCCGCQIRRVNAKRRGSRFVVKMDVSYNY